MGMKLSELIAAIGDDNVLIQNLDESADSLDWSIKKGTKITFSTMEHITTNGTEKLGLVVWLPREAVQKVLAQNNTAIRSEDRTALTKDRGETRE